MTTALLVGTHGYGAVHLRNLERLGERVALIGLADPQGGPEEGFGHDVPCWPTLTEALGSGLRPDVVIVATPTGVHFELAREALEHGSHVYLEKPPVASIAQFSDLLAAQDRAGRAVQVGFQSFGSAALAELAELGAPRSLATWAGWRRDDEYWSRSAWAGKRTLNGAPVADGVLTNALSHAIATSLRIAGARGREDVARVEVELFRANDIEADDTSSARITLRNGCVISAALTLASDEEVTPVIEVRTPDTDALFAFRDGLVTYSDGRTAEFGSVDLFEQLLDHLDLGAPLLSPLADTGAYMEVLQAVASAPDPLPIPARFLTRTGSRVSVDGIARTVARTARAGALFSEVHAPFAPKTFASGTTVMRVRDREIAVRNDGSDVTATSGRRPFLHPLRTFEGTVVTAAHPEDHDWHLGVSFALQDVNGTNFWGGPTYVRDRGYRWLDDHGRIETTSLFAEDGGFTARARWVDASETPLLDEETRWDFFPTDDPRAWAFRTSTVLRAGATPVALGSPGTNGRTGGGYGGFTWRFPEAADVEVLTEEASGESAVHGTRSDWLALSGRFGEGVATIAVAAGSGLAGSSPWFVRVEDYLGIGSALAWDTPIRLDTRESLAVSFTGIVADGRLSKEEISTLLTNAQRHEEER